MELNREISVQSVDMNKRATQLLQLVKVLLFYAQFDIVMSLLENSSYETKCFYCEKFYTSNGFSKVLKVCFPVWVFFEQTKIENALILRLPDSF